MSLARKVGYPDVGRLAYANAGGPLLSAMVSTTAGQDNGVFRAQKGKVIVVTQVFGNAQGKTAVATTPLARGANEGNSLVLVNAAGSTASTLSFKAFDRDNETFNGGSPGEMAAHFDDQISWKPRYPFIIPSGWSLKSNNSSSNTTGLGVHGYELDEADARRLGFDTSTAADQADRRWITIGSGVTNGTATLVAARTGMSIQILEVVVRLQPSATGTASIVLDQDDGDTIFTFRNDLRANGREWKFSPGLYLEPGKALRITGVAGSSGRGSVIIVGRYVDTADVPGDAWWCHRAPAAISPDSTTFASVWKRASTTLSLYYPKSNTTATTPGVGKRHVVEGFSISVGKDGAATSDLALMALTTGTAGGTLAVSPLSIAQTNALLSPIISLQTRDQICNLVVDELNVPCPANDGIISVDMQAVDEGLVASPSSATANIDFTFVTVWGRTEPCNRSATDNHALASTNP